MTIVKTMHGTMPVDLHLVDNDDMDRMLKLPSARACGTPQYIDHKDRMYPVPSLAVEFIDIVDQADED